MLKPTVIKLQPGQDLKIELDNIAQRRSMSGGYIVTCTGSLEKVVLRYPNQSQPVELVGIFEIVSLSGTLSSTNSTYRLIIDDGEKQSSEARLFEGSIIRTSTEIVISRISSINFSRNYCPQDNLKAITRLLRT